MLTIRCSTDSFHLPLKIHFLLAYISLLSIMRCQPQVVKIWCHEVNGFRLWVIKRWTIDWLTCKPHETKRLGWGNFSDGSEGTFIKILQHNYLALLNDANYLSVSPKHVHSSMTEVFCVVLLFIKFCILWICCWFLFCLGSVPRADFLIFSLFYMAHWFMRIYRVCYFLLSVIVKDPFLFMDKSCLSWSSYCHEWTISVAELTASTVVCLVISVV